MRDTVTSERNPGRFRMALITPPREYPPPGTDPLTRKKAP
jgi:hypothetical protein